jgi:hypothetical protein
VEEESSKTGVNAKFSEKNRPREAVTGPKSSDRSLRSLLWIIYLLSATVSAVILEMTSNNFNHKGRKGLEAVYFDFVFSASSAV